MVLPERPDARELVKSLQGLASLAIRSDHKSWFTDFVKRDFSDKPPLRLMIRHHFDVRRRRSDDVCLGIPLTTRFDAGYCQRTTCNFCRSSRSHRHHTCNHLNHQKQSHSCVFQIERRLPLREHSRSGSFQPQRQTCPPKVVGESVTSQLQI